MVLKKARPRNASDLLKRRQNCFFEKRRLVKKVSVFAKIPVFSSWETGNAVFGAISPIMAVFYCFPAATGTLRSLPSWIERVLGRLQRLSRKTN